MELTKEFIEANKLEQPQVEAVTKFFSESVLPDLKKEWDGKANENAEGILSGAVKMATEKHGVKLEREQGEKWGDFLGRFSDTLISKEKQALTDKQKEIDEKLKNFKGGDEYKVQLEALQLEKDGLLKTLAELEPLKGLDEKYKEATDKLSGLKLEVSFNNVKPNFPEDANKYEVDAKWREFQQKILEKYDIEIVEGVPMAIDKENKYKQEKLSTLVETDENIKVLLQGRQQGGTGATPADMIEIKELPFKIKKGSSSEELSSQIRGYLAKKLNDVTSPQYATEFSKLYAIAKKSA